MGNLVSCTRSQDKQTKKKYVNKEEVVDTEVSCGEGIVVGQQWRKHADLLTLCTQEFVDQSQHT